MLDLFNADFSGGEIVEEMSRVWNESTMQDLDDRIVKLRNDDKGGKDVIVESRCAIAARLKGGDFPTSWWQQFSVLSYRNALTLLRNPMVMWMRLGMYVMMGLFVGTFFFQVDFDDTQEHIAGIFFMSAFLTFLTM